MRSLRGIDHLVVAVDDLPSARERFSRLGFLTTPLGRQPWGTANHLVQFPGNFIELVGIVDASRLVPTSKDHFSFSAHNDLFLRRGEGMSMLVLSTEDAAADADDWRGRGLEAYAPFHWSRPATLPDGSEAIVAFTLAFVTSPHLPEIAFFSCQQHNPEAFWKPEYQAHENGARRVSSATLVVPDPQRHGPFLADLVGDTEPRSDQDGVTVAAANGVIRIQSPQDFAARFPGAAGAPVSREAGLLAATVQTDDLERVADCLGRSGVPFARGDGNLYVGPAEACGVVVEFRPA